MTKAVTILAASLLIVAGACSTDGPTEVPPPPVTDGRPAGPDTAVETEPVASGADELFAAACGGRLSVRSPGPLPPHLTSVSGLAASLRHDDVVWAVEDSFEPAEVTALDPAGRVVATIRLVGEPLMNLDWEDLAVAPGPDGRPWIHVADIGDNLGIRTEVRIHRFPEPDLVDSAITPETTRARYEVGRPDAEALLVDRLGSTWIIDKTPIGPTRIFRLDDDGVLRERGTLDLGGEQVTAADLSEDGTLLALRTDRQVRLHRVPDGGDIVDALVGPSCATPDLDEPQGESVAFLRGATGFITVSEDESGRPVDLHVTAPGDA
jgi:hypothetical protein